MNQRAFLPLLLLLLLLPFSNAGCGGGGAPTSTFEPITGVSPDDTPSTPGATPTPTPTPPPPPPTPPGTTTTQPRVPLGSTPPVGLTWYVGYTENATLGQLQAIYSRIVSMNTALWNVTEGQVYIYRVTISDNVGPGVKTSTWWTNPGTINTSGLDIVVWPTSTWDLGGTGGFTVWTSPPQVGRTGLIIGVPSDASTHVWLHEAGHLIWNLSWANSFGLDDEYIDGVQDPACVMESTNTPQRWCSDANHVNQTSQPHACWHQILIDYGNYAHTDTDSASTSPWTPKVTYNDAP